MRNLDENLLKIGILSRGNIQKLKPEETKDPGINITQVKMSARAPLLTTDEQSGVSSRLEVVRAVLSRTLRSVV